MPDSIQTPHKCKVCGGTIVEYTESIAVTDSLHIPTGPASRNYYRQVSQYSCMNCGVMYDWRFFGGKPHSQKLREEQEAHEAEEQNKARNAELDKHWKESGWFENLTEVIENAKKTKTPRS